MVPSNNKKSIVRIPLFAVVLSLLGLVMSSSPPAQALPGAPQAAECQSGVGGRLFSNGGDVEVEILPADAGFTIELNLMAPGPQRLIATNRDAGSIVKVGSFPAGAELIFGVFVRETQRTFLMGMGSGNPDGLPHAEVMCFGARQANIGFEDQMGGGDKDYNDLLFTVRQTQSCSFSISPSIQSFGYGGGRGTVTLNTSSGCSWSVASQVNWIVITSGSAGSDGGTVNYSVAVNPGSNSRTGRIMLQGESFNVVQDGAGADPRITSTVRKGKKLFIYGANFDGAAVILVNGEQQKTLYDVDDPTTVLIGKKIGKFIQPGDTLRVRSSSGALSPQYTYTP